MQGAVVGYMCHPCPPGAQLLLLGLIVGHSGTCSVCIMLVEVLVGPKTMDIHLPLVSMTTKGLASPFSTPNPMALCASKVEMAL